MTASPPDIAVAGDLSRQFAAIRGSLEYQHLPASAVTGAKKTLLDSIGVTLAASGAEPAVRPVVDLVRESGGRQESTVLGAGFRAPATEAAFANGAMAHSLNYDDQTPWGQHSSSSVVPAVLAIAERVGAVSGAISSPLSPSARTSSPACGATSAGNRTGTCPPCWARSPQPRQPGAVLRLTPEQLTHAFGIASMQAGGVMELVTGLGSQLGGLYAGFPARAAVTAALLAQKGTTGHQAVFEGRLGFFATYFGGKYDRAAMVADLGDDFKGVLHAVQAVGRDRHRAQPHPRDDRRRHPSRPAGARHQRASRCSSVTATRRSAHRCRSGAPRPPCSTPGSACRSWWRWRPSDAGCVSPTSPPKR